MYWLKKYEAFKWGKRKEDAFFIYTPVKDKGMNDKGVDEYSIQTKESIINDIKWFNNIFNTIGVWIKEGGVPVTMTLFNAEVHFDLARNLNPATETGNISSRSRETTSWEDSVNMFYNIYKDDVFPMSDECIVKQFGVHFNHDGMETSSFDSYGSSPKVQYPVYNVLINKDTEKNFMSIVLDKLDEYMRLHLSAQVYAKGEGYTTDNPIYQTLTKAFKRNMTIEELHKIVFNAIGHCSNSQQMFNKLKGTIHYPIFQKIGGKNVDNASDMVDMGFTD